MPFRTIALALALWFTIFLVIGASGAAARLQAPFPQIIIAALVLLLLAAYALSKRPRGCRPLPTGNENGNARPSQKPERAHLPP